MWPTLDSSNPLGNIHKTPLLCWQHIILLNTEPVVKLIFDDRIFAHPQGGAIFFRKFAVVIDPERILSLINLKRPDMIVHIFKQETPLYKLIFGSK